MYKLVFVLAGILFSYCPTYAQRNKDSLLLVTKNGKASEQINAFISLSDAVVYDDPKLAKEYAGKAFTISEKANIDSGKAGAYNRMGVAYDVSGNYDSAMYFYEKALPIYQKIKSKKGIGSAYNNMGLIAWNLANYDKALAYFFVALKNFEDINNERFMGNVLNNIGLVYIDNEKPLLAINYHRKAMDLYTKRGDNYNIGAVSTNLSNAFTVINNKDSIIYYNQKAIYFNKLANDDYGLSMAYSGYAYILQKEKRYDSAKYYYFQSLKIKERMQEERGICITLLALATLSDDLNEKEDQLKYLNRAKEIAERGNLKKESENTYLQLSQYYESKSPVIALQYFQKYAAVKDSIFNETKNKQITELNTKYEVEKKELILKEQKLTIIKKNYLLIGITAGTLLLTLLGISYYRRMRLIEEKKSQEAIVKEQQKAIIAVLQAEEKERKRVAAELHDGVGQMMSVARMHLSQFEELAIANGQEYQEKYDHLADMIDESCAEVRNISHQMMPNALLKQGLAKAVRNFISQVKNPNLSINLYTEGLDENLPQITSAMLYRIIQECVNNVIKHSRATSLDISLLRNSTEVTATIEDNGKGFDRTQNDYREGIGLQNIRDRITFLKGELEIDSKPGKGTLIAIYIPV